MSKPALDPETSREVVELALWTGQLLLHAGAQSLRIERTVHGLATALGAHWVDVLVLSDGLVITTSEGREFRTRVRRVTALGVNLALIDAIDAINARVRAGDLDVSQLRAELDRVSGAAPSFSRVVVVLAVGLACGAFSRLFGGDWPTFGITVVSASAAMFLRQTLARCRFNTFLVVIATAIIAGLVPSVAHLVGLLPGPEVALASSVLLLIPGVHLINCARDLLRGYLAIGMARGLLGLITTLCIALGLVVVLKATGVPAHQGFGASNAGLWYVARDAFWSGVAATGFAVLFNVPSRGLWACYLVGSSGHGARALLSLFEVTLVPGTFVASLLVGMLGTWLAGRLRLPVGVVSLPAAIPMVPGVTAFRSMIALIALSAPSGEPRPVQVLLVDAVGNFTTTWLVLAALAVGIALPSLVAHREKPVV